MSRVGDLVVSGLMKGNLVVSGVAIVRREGCTQSMKDAASACRPVPSIKTGLAVAI